MLHGEMPRGGFRHLSKRSGGTWAPTLVSLDQHPGKLPFYKRTSPINHPRWCKSPVTSFFSHPKGIISPAGTSSPPCLRGTKMLPDPQIFSAGVTSRHEPRCRQFRFCFPISPPLLLTPSPDTTTLRYIIAGCQRHPHA